ncbi:unnamed protein product [Rotaria sp. Silwood1]|nr:unnamed protein product [Rotaria sp. Silwood1]CAF4027147.1 unnamed protein product [Rotaria sp. Silwood1]CAF4997331.1 unnamed protein product [Rotaria sp. Silwood1]
MSAEDADAINGFFGNYQRPKSIRRFELIFLILGILGALIMDGFTIYRLVHVHSLKHPDSAFGILILVHSIFLIIFLISGILYQRITDIIAFLLGAILLTVYAIVHFLARRNTDTDTTQANIRLISSVLLNLYNYTGYPTADLIFLIIGIPIALLWLFMGIAMGIKYSKDMSHGSTISTTTSAPMLSLLPMLPVLYVCLSFNFVFHLSSIGLGFWCKKNFNNGLKEAAFQTDFDTFITRMSSVN